jgi:hypothetical protein
LKNAFCNRYVFPSTNPGCFSCAERLCKKAGKAWNLEPAIVDASKRSMYGYTRPSIAVARPWAWRCYSLTAKRNTPMRNYWWLCCALHHSGATHTQWRCKLLELYWKYLACTRNDSRGQGFGAHVRPPAFALCFVL